MSFGKALRDLRLAAGWTQEALAEAAGLSTRTIIEVEAGKRRPRLSTVALLSDALRLSGSAREALLTRSSGLETGPEEVDDGRREVRTHDDLPRDIEDFVGRAEELARLLTAAESRGSTAVVVMAVDGTPGVGKTTLALHAAHRLAESYPDGRFFLDLRANVLGQAPKEPSAALDALLRAAGVAADRVPAGLPEKAALWRSVVAGRRVLLILDDAISAEQVDWLIPGSPTCFVIVTSRHPLVGLDGARFLTLGVLPEEEAATLFGQVAGHSRVDGRQSDVAHIIASCGGLPSAVRIAAAKTRHAPARNPADLARVMRDGRGLTARAGSSPDPSNNDFLGAPAVVPGRQLKALPAPSRPGAREVVGRVTP